MIRVHFNFSLKSVWTQNWLKKRQKPFPVLILSPTSIPVHAFFRFLAKKKWLYYYNFLSFPIAPKRNSITLASPPLQPPPAPLTDILLLWWPPTTSPIISYPYRFPPTQASSLLTATSSHKRPPPMPEAARPSNTHTRTHKHPRRRRLGSTRPSVESRCAEPSHLAATRILLQPLTCATPSISCTVSNNVGFVCVFVRR